MAVLTSDLEIALRRQLRSPDAAQLLRFREVATRRQELALRVSDEVARACAEEVERAERAMRDR